MDAHLDGGSSAPLYQQVLDLLKSDIEQGTYPVDSQIPTELELSKMYGVGRVTVRRAIEELVGEGYLTKRQGRGTFVTATKKFARCIRRTMFRVLPKHALKTA